MEKIHLFILASNDMDSYEVREALADSEVFQVVGYSNSVVETEIVMEKSKVDILLVAPAKSQIKYEYIEKVVHEYPLTQVIILEDDLAEETLHNAIYLGAKDVIIKPFDTKKITQSIIRVQQLAEKKTEVVSYSSSLKRKKKSGKVLTFFSTKGGVGKTFLSINFATALAERSDKRVVLVDLDLDCGNASLALNLPPKLTILDMVNDIYNMDNDIIESYLLPHESGLKVLASNVRFDINDLIKSDQVKTILEMLAESFDYVIVDMPGRFNDASMPALALADQLLVVVTPELSTIRNVKNLLGSLNALNFPPDKIRIILNKYGKNAEIHEKDIAITLNQKVTETVGMDYKYVNSSLNRGVPFIMDYPTNNVTKDLHKLVELVTGEEVQTKESVLAGIVRKVRKE